MNYATEIGILADGIPSSISDDGEAYANDGVREIVKRIIAYSPREVSLLTKESTLTEDGVVTWEDFGYPVLSVSRKGSNMPVIEQPYSAYPLFSNSRSIHARTIEDSVYYNLNGVYYIYPPLEKLETAHVISIGVNVISNFNGNTHIPHFPDKYEWSVILFAASRILLVKMNEIVQPFLNDTSGFNITQTTTYIVTDEDVELAQAELAKHNVLSQEAQAEFNNAAQRYTALRNEFESSTPHPVSTGGK